VIRFAQLTPRMAGRDAVGNDIRGIEAVVRRSGFETAVFANDWDAEQSDVRSARDLHAWLRDDRDVLLYHYSIYWPAATQLLRELPGRKLLKSHNVTPPEFFAPYNEAYAAFCRAGRAQLTELLATQPYGLAADSAFNAGEAIAAGMPEESCRVIPPFHRCEELFAGAAPERSTLHENSDARNNSAALTILMTGRIVPNKGYDFLLRVFARLFRLARERKLESPRFVEMQLVCVGP